MQLLDLWFMGTHLECASATADDSYRQAAHFCKLSEQLNFEFYWLTWIF